MVVTARSDQLISLSYLTAQPLSPPDAVRLAAELGYDAVGLRALPSSPGGPYSPFIEEPQLLEDTCKAVRSSGAAVLDVEVIQFTPQFSVRDCGPFLDVCGALGARGIIAIGVDPEEGRLVDSFGRFCEAAARLKLDVYLEFVPWTAVRDANAALRIVTSAGQRNGRIMVDPLHVARSKTTIADLATIPRQWLGCTQICDAPAKSPATEEGLIFAARFDRLLPGEGELDLVSMFSALADDVPVGIEIPSQTRIGEVGSKEWARMALEATRVTLQSVRDSRTASK